MLLTFQAKHNGESMQGSGAPRREITDVNVSSFKHSHTCTPSYTVTIKCTHKFIVSIHFQK